MLAFQIDWNKDHLIVQSKKPVQAVPEQNDEETKTILSLKKPTVSEISREKNKPIFETV